MAVFGQATFTASAFFVLRNHAARVSWFAFKATAVVSRNGKTTIHKAAVFG